MEHRILTALLSVGETYPLKLVRLSAEPLNKRGIYTQLDRLEKKGFVSSRLCLDKTANRWSWRKQHYQVTEAGKRALGAWEAATEAWTGS